MSNLIRIENWYPPFGLVEALTGDVYGHPRFPEGHFVRTSKIVGFEIDGSVVLTKSGSRYILGEPAQALTIHNPHARLDYIISLRKHFHGA